jgi:acetate kinase
MLDKFILTINGGSSSLKFALFRAGKIQRANWMGNSSGLDWSAAS